MILSHLAEGTLVRSTNALYQCYGVGRIQKVRGEQAKVEFNPSVFMAPPYRPENQILHLAERGRMIGEGRWTWRYPC